MNAGVAVPSLSLPMAVRAADRAMLRASARGMLRGAVRATRRAALLPVAFLRAAFPWAAHRRAAPLQPALRCRTLIPAAFLLAAPLAAGPAAATPRYSARYQQNCNLCHQNPTGGGMRGGYATQYLVPRELAMIQVPDDDLGKLNGQLTPSISVGTDVRTLHLYSGEKAHRNNFFQMQGDLYVNFQPDERFSIYLDRGWNQSLEYFGLGYLLPFNGYVKVGRFTPAFGWKFDDHTLFVRDLLGFAPPSQTDVGVEIGVYPRTFALIASVLNGSPGLTIDSDSKQAATARAVYRANLAGIGLAAGGSFLYNETPGEVTRMGGPFWYLSAGRLTWLGEIDWRRRDRKPADRTELVTSQEASFELTRGLFARATYSFQDPDVDRKSGSRTRLGFGVDALVYPFLGVQATVVHDRTEGGPATPVDEYDQSQMMIHFLF